MANMSLLAVDPGGRVSSAELQRYRTLRSQCIAIKVAALSGNDKVKAWWDEFSEESLSSDGKYLGDASGEYDAVVSLRTAKSTNNPVEMVTAIEDFICFFCGFHSIKTRCLANAVHFQFEVDQEALRSMELPKPSENDKPTDAVRRIFDASEVAAAELLLRAVVETDDGSLIANPMSPGRAMGLLQKLPLYAQFIMVLTNAVEAVWYEQAIPNCKMSLNVYASLLADGAPILEMIDGVSSVEVMEMTKGVERGGVREWVAQIRDRGIEVLLDDFDSRHPGAGSSCDGIKVSVFANAFHTLQAFNEDGAQIARDINKEQLNDMDFRDYHFSLVPKVQPGITKMVFEGSENCMKSTVSPGPPLNFSIAQATTASAHVYQTAARIQSLQNPADVQPVALTHALFSFLSSVGIRGCSPKNPGLLMLHQGGRALYDDEDFDDSTLAVLGNLGKDPAAARTGDAGTFSWMGEEAKRRANMKTRPLVCGLAPKHLAAHMQSAETGNTATVCRSLPTLPGKQRSPSVEGLMKCEIRGLHQSAGRWFGLFLLLMSWRFFRNSPSFARLASCLASWLQERATKLSLTDKKILAVCAGTALAARRQASVARDMLLGERATHASAIRQE